MIDYYCKKNAIWGIQAKSQEQNEAINGLMNPNIDLVVLYGEAGSGKTLMALAAGLVHIMEEKSHTEMIITRSLIPIGNEIGFLPGTEEEKLLSWMGCVTDNLEALDACHPQVIDKLNYCAIEFMRGRSFYRKWIFVDECQNLTVSEMKTILTRVGKGSKLVCTGDLSQIDKPRLKADQTGLKRLIDVYSDWQHAVVLKLPGGERSRLVNYTLKHYGESIG